MLFALPFIVRPFGALLIGWVSDNYGRKPGLLISLGGALRSRCCRLHVASGTRAAPGRCLAIASRAACVLSCAARAAGLTLVTTIQGLLPATSLGRMLFVIMRALQGIFVAGESSASVVYMSASLAPALSAASVTSAPDHHRLGRPSLTVSPRLCRKRRTRARWV